MKKISKTKTTTTNIAGKTSGPTRQATSTRPGQKKEPSSHLEGPAETLPQGQFDPIIVRNGEIAYSNYFDIENGKFAIGGIGTATRKDLLGAKKRVPNDYYVCRALSQYLQEKGIRDVSYSTIYDWMRANETREQLGGENKAPKISISFYVAVSRNEIPLEKRREYLEQAIKEELSVQGLKQHISGMGQAGASNGNSESAGPFPDIATLERIISESQSLLLGKSEEFREIDPHKNSRTIARLENLAIFIWQLRDDIANGEAKEGMEA